MGAVAVSKFVPATTIVLTVPVVAVVKVMVAVTAVAALMVLERAIEGVTKAALKMAGNVPEPPSRFAGVATSVVT